MATWYKLIFKQNQPIHIGSIRWGVVNETEIFITGQAIWGALVNAFLHSKKEFNIEEAKTKFKKITNFFPTNREDGKVLLPNYKDGRFHLGDLEESKFRMYFVETCIKTSIVPLFRSAREEALYELDYILPKPKLNSAVADDDSEFLKGFKNLYWVGYLWVEEDSVLDFLKNLKKIYVGGDTRYGLGELELINGYGDKDDGDITKEVNNLCSKEHSPFFIDAELVKEFEGELVLMAEFDFRQKDPMVEDARFYTFVGSKMLNGFELGEEEICQSLDRGKIKANEVKARS